MAGDGKSNNASASDLTRKSSSMVSKQQPSLLPLSSAPSSVSIATLLKAGKVIKTTLQPALLELEKFNIKDAAWIKLSPQKFDVATEKFASGGFRDAYRAHRREKLNLGSDWVLKKYHSDTIASINETLGLSEEDHARKQVQLHAVAEHVIRRLTEIKPPEFGQSLKYTKAYFCRFGDHPVTLEPFYNGNFIKFINNDGNIQSLLPHFEDLFQKAECLVHFSYEFSNKKFMLMDIQGNNNYDLYDPEIATHQLMDDDNELLFCAGNLGEHAIKNFVKQHKCNSFCNLLNLTSLKLD